MGWASWRTLGGDWNNLRWWEGVKAGKGKLPADPGAR